jgi:hypothetical protein
LKEISPSGGDVARIDEAGFALPGRIVDDVLARHDDVAEVVLHEGVGPQDGPRDAGSL